MKILNFTSFSDVFHGIYFYHVLKTNLIDHNKPKQLLKWEVLNHDKAVVLCCVSIFPNSFWQKHIVGWFFLWQCWFPLSIFRMSGIVFLCHIFGSLARKSNSGETFVRFFSVFRFIWDGQTRGKIYVNCGFMRTKSRVKDKTNWIVSVWGLLRLGGDQRASKEGSLHWWDLRVSSSEQSDIFWISVK